MKNFLIISNYAPKKGFNYPGGFTCPKAHRDGSHQKMMALERFWEEKISWDILNIEDEYHNLEQKISSKKYDLIILSGSPYNIEEEAIWLKKLKSFLKKYLKKSEKNRTPILGICFGMQLLTEILGGELKSLPEIFSADVKLLDKNKNILGYTFTFHENYISQLPKKSEIVAYGPNKMPYVVNFSDKIFGIQSHPENKLKNSEENKKAEIFWKKYFGSLKI